MRTREAIQSDKGNAFGLLLEAMLDVRELLLEGKAERARFANEAHDAVAILTRVGREAERAMGEAREEFHNARGISIVPDAPNAIGAAANENTGTD